MIDVNEKVSLFLQKVIRRQYGSEYIVVDSDAAGFTFTFSCTSVCGCSAEVEIRIEQSATG